MTDKVLVEILELSGNTYFKRYPVDPTGCVEIHQGGMGPKDIKENPKLDPDCWFTKGTLFKTRYLKYPRLSNRFLKRGEHTAPPVAMRLIQKLLNSKILQAYIPKEETKLIDYISIGLSLVLVFFLVILPRIG